MPISQAAVICPEPEAAKAGGVILEAGGNAVDAAIAAAFTQGVVNPLMCGLGGTGRLMYYQAATKEIKLFDFGSRAGSKARPDVYSGIEESVFANRYRVKDWENYIGYKAMVIPSLVRGLWDVHSYGGSMPWQEIMQPAVDYAKKGFKVDEFRFSMWDPDLNKKSDSPPPLVILKATEECARIYLKKGKVYQVGETLIQRDYANTLQCIASGGADEFYRGDIAAEIARDLEEHGSLVTRDDLANCRTEFKKPVRGIYKGLEVITEGSPGMGALEIQALQILENIDLQGLGWRSADYYHVLARVFQLIYGDRSRYNADPRFVDVPEHQFLSLERASKLAAGIMESRIQQEPTRRGGSTDTTHVSVVDRWGNAAAITHSNGKSSGVVTPGLGFLYNHHMHNFDPRPDQLDSIAPGKAPLFGCSPLMMLDNGRLKLVSGSKSRYRVTAEIQMLVDLFEFGASLEEAIKHFRIHAEYDPNTVYLEPSVPESIKDGLTERGWNCTILDMSVPMCTLLMSDDGVEGVQDYRGGKGLYLV